MSNWKPFKEAEPLTAESLREMIELAEAEKELNQVDEMPVPRYVYEKILELINQQPQSEAEGEGGEGE